jgi:hypothetical protein
MLNRTSWCYEASPFRGLTPVLILAFRVGQRGAGLVSGKRPAVRPLSVSSSVVQGRWPSHFVTIALRPQNWIERKLVNEMRGEWDVSEIRTRPPQLPAAQADGAIVQDRLVLSQLN